MELTYGNEVSWIKTIWDALDEVDLREIIGDKRMDDVCTAMAWVSEELGIHELFDEFDVKPTKMLIK